MRYFDASRHWTKKVVPHLGDRKLNKILARDFNKYLWGLWRKRFEPGNYPHDYENSDWWIWQRGPMPRYWMYTKAMACHWLVNFNLRLASMAMPRQDWRIITSDKHSSVWDGEGMMFDLNFLAFDVPAQECFDLAYDEELPVGVERLCGMPQYWKNEMRRRELERSKA